VQRNARLLKCRGRAFALFSPLVEYREARQSGFRELCLVRRVLVLNATYEPLSIVSVQRAVVLLLKEKAELIEAASERLHAERASLPVPLVIRLVYYVRIPRHIALAPTRHSVLVRDNFTCQYCGATPGRSGLSLDHVLPRSRGGQTTWDNVVAACRPCNMRKGSRTPEEAGIALRRSPGRPHYLAFLLLSGASSQEVWEKYAFG